MILLATVAVSGLAVNDRTYFPVDSEVYDLLRFVRLEAGLSIPWSSRSLTAHDVRRQLEPVEAAELSSPGREAVARIEALLEPDPVYQSPDEPFSFNMRPVLSLEGYLNTEGTPRDWLGSAYSDETDNPGRLVYGDIPTSLWIGDRSPLVSFPAELWAGDALYGRMDFDLLQAPVAALERERYANVPLSVEDVDYMFPYRGFVFAGSDLWFLHVGRDQLRWGSGRTGVMALSDSPDYYDFVRFGVGSRRFRFTSLIAHLDPWVTRGDVERVDAAPGGDFGRWNDREEVLGESDLDDFDPSDFSDRRGEAKVMHLNRVEVDLPGSVQLALNEGMLYAGRRGDLRFLNPLMIYHNYFELGRGSAFLGLEGNWNPWRNMNLYGEFALMQIGTEFKADDIPDSFGWLAGAEGFIPIEQGYLSAYGEFAYTNPFYGIREEPLRSWHWRRRIMPNFGDIGGEIVTAPIGYRFGPDSAVIGGGVGYTAPGGYNIDLDLTYVRRGETRIDSAYEEGDEPVSRSTPSGTAERAIILELGAGRRFPGLAGDLGLGDMDITVGLDTALISIENYRNISGETFLDLQVSPSVSLRF